MSDWTMKCPWVSWDHEDTACRGCGKQDCSPYQWSGRKKRGRGRGWVPQCHLRVQFQWDEGLPWHHTSSQQCTMEMQQLTSRFGQQSNSNTHNRQIRNKRLGVTGLKDWRMRNNWLMTLEFLFGCWNSSQSRVDRTAIGLCDCMLIDVQLYT